MQSLTIWHWIIIAILVVLVAGAILLFARAINNRRPVDRSVREGSDITPGSGPSGFGGWLVLLAVGVVLAPVITIYKFVNSGNFDLSSAGELYLLQITDIAFYVVVIFLQLCTASLMIFRKRQFRALYIVTAIAMILFWPAEFLLITTQVSVLTPEPFGTALQSMINDRNTPNDAIQWVRTFIGVVIWLLYVIRSQRVANTFVR